MCIVRYFHCKTCGHPTSLAMHKVAMPRPQQLATFRKALLLDITGVELVQGSAPKALVS